MQLAIIFLLYALGGMAFNIVIGAVDMIASFRGMQATPRVLKWILNLFWPVMILLIALFAPDLTKSPVRSKQ